MVEELKKEEAVVEKKKLRPKQQPVRLYTRAIFTGYKRGQHTQHTQQALLDLDGCKTKEAAEFYLGKRVVYVYKAKRERKKVPTTRKGTVLKKSRTRSIWGKIIGTHGNGGNVRAKFRSNLPGQAIGHPLRVMMYPSRI